jgi:hypothetical protein
MFGGGGGRVDKEEEVPAVKCWLHRVAEWGSQGQTHQHTRTKGLEIRRGAPEDDNDRRLCVPEQFETLPSHEPGCEDRGKVKDLKQDLKWQGKSWLELRITNS